MEIKTRQATLVRQHMGKRILEFRAMYRRTQRH